MSVQFSNCVFEENKIKYENIALEYNQIESFSWSDIAEYVNASPIVEKLKINIFFKNGHQINLYEKIDIRPASLCIPFSHLFNSKKRNESKRKIAEARLQNKIRFIGIVKYIEEKTGIKGKKYKCLTNQSS